MSNMQVLLLYMYSLYNVCCFLFSRARTLYSNFTFASNKPEFSHLELLKGNQHFRVGFGIHISIIHQSTVTKTQIFTEVKKGM